MPQIVKITRDREAGAGYVYFQKPYKGISKKQVVVTNDIILDFDKDDCLVGIEFLDWNIVKQLRKPSRRKK